MKLSRGKITGKKWIVVLRQSLWQSVVTQYHDNGSTADVGDNILSLGFAGVGGEPKQHVMSCYLWSILRPALPHLCNDPSDYTYTRHR